MKTLDLTPEAARPTFKESGYLTCHPAQLSLRLFEDVIILDIGVFACPFLVIEDPLWVVDTIVGVFVSWTVKAVVSVMPFGNSITGRKEVDIVVLRHFWGSNVSVKEGERSVTA